MDRFLGCLKWILLALNFWFICACAPLGTTGAIEDSSTSGGGPTTGTPDTNAYKPVALLWEGSQKDGVLWSAYSYQIIGNDVADVLLPGTTDVANFCPNYANLTNSEKVNFWAYLVSAVAKFESGFKPTSRYLETTLGNDAITHLPLYSEGLLQLSYQDVLVYPFCAFDWVGDKILGTSNANRSILDPFKNLECGIKILATQVKNQHLIATTKNVYWSTLKPGGTYGKVPQIQTLTKSLPFCSKN